MHDSSRPSAWRMGFPLPVALVLALGVGGASAQGIPDEFINLQLLPEDITQAELVGTMRGFASALGVRCSFCHMVSDMLNQPDDDFASDEKARKRKARVMIQMVNRINRETLPTLPERTAPHVEVACATCHAGISRPVPIDREIERTIAEEGIDAALAHYRELRERYYGSRAYDFGFSPLDGLAQRFLARERAAEAVRVLELNVEYHPTWLPSLVLLGQAHEQNGDNESALRVYRGILDMDSSIRFYDFYARQARERIDSIDRGG